MKNTQIITVFIFTLIITMLLTSGAMATPKQAQFNPVSHYFMQGQLVSPWQLVVGNSTNYYVPIKNGVGETYDGKLKVTTINEQGRSYIKATWDKKLKGGSNLSISGKTIDLSKYEHLVALAVDIKIEKKTRAKITWKLDCGYPCGGTIDITHKVKHAPLNEWYSIPVPLNCFSKAGAKLKKIKSPFSLNATSDLEMSFSNVRMVLLPEGEKGCTK